MSLKSTFRAKRYETCIEKKTDAADLWWHEAYGFVSNIHGRVHATVENTFQARSVELSTVDEAAVVHIVLLLDCTNGQVAAESCQPYLQLFVVQGGIVVEVKKIEIPVDII